MSFYVCLCLTSSSPTVVYLQELFTCSCCSKKSTNMAQYPYEINEWMNEFENIHITNCRISHVEMAKSIWTPERYTDVWSAAISCLFKHVEIEIFFFLTWPKNGTIYIITTINTKQTYKCDRRTLQISEEQISISTRSGTKENKNPLDAYTGAIFEDNFSEIQEQSHWRVLFSWSF